MQLNAFVRISMWLMISYCLCLLWLFFFFSNMLFPQRCFITYKSVLVGSDSAASEGQVAVLRHTHTHSLYINLNAWRTEQVFVVVVFFFYPFHVFRLINRDIYWAQAQVSDTSAEDSGSPSSQHAPTLHHCLEFLDYQFAIFDILFFFVFRPGLISLYMASQGETAKP